jgi:transcriptional regulator with XRE-family HTH domain
MEERDLDPIRRALKDARLSRRLTQQALAHRLGLRQRQISDLERATTDPRLSTVQNVARTLDLELVLIPRPLIAAVQALQRPSPNSGRRPMYALGLDSSESQEPDDDPNRESRDRRSSQHAGHSANRGARVRE